MDIRAYSRDAAQALAANHLRETNGAAWAFSPTTRAKFEMAAIRGVLAAIALFAVLSACTDFVFDASYATRAEAEADGAMWRGWIPVWVPPDATHLREVHDLDSNKSALVFDIPRTLDWKPPAPCRKADRGELAAPGFDRDWLPDLASGYVFYRCPNVTLPGSAPLVSAVAVHESGRHAVHWRAR